jgi:membrane protease subunit HflK
MQGDNPNRGGWDRGGPPDLMDLVSKAMQRFGGAGKGVPGKGFLLAGVVVIIILIFVFTGLYTIDPEEMGVVQRFGKYVRTEPPGLHFKFPFGVEKVTKVKTARVWKEEFGFRTVLPGIRTKYVKRGYEDESLMLTGDLNVIDVEWIVQFRIKDPVKFLFKVRDVKSAIRDISEAVVRRVVGNRGETDVLTVGREEVGNSVQTELQKILDRFETGIHIVTVKLQDVNPPDPVKAAFNEVNEARQEKERMINQAQEAFNKEIPKALGEARKTIAEAEGYAMEQVNRAQGDVSRFSAVLKEYQDAKEVTRRRLYLETIGEILPKTREIYIVDGDQRMILPFLKLGREMGETK